MQSPIVPSMGRVVIVSLAAGTHPVVTEAPAIITRAEPDSDTIDLFVMVAGWDGFPVEGISYSEQPTDSHSWHWMEYQKVVAAERDSLSGQPK